MAEKFKDSLFDDETLKALRVALDRVAMELVRYSAAIPQHTVALSKDDTYMAAGFERIFFALSQNLDAGVQFLERVERIKSEEATRDVAAAMVGPDQKLLS